jgi:hypothetical protein
MVATIPTPLATDCTKFVKDPIGKLKSAVISSHGRNYVNVVMGPREFEANASLIQLEEIEVIHASTNRDISDEPLAERSCFRGVKDVPPELARLPPWFGMVDGKLAPFTYGAPGTTSEMIENLDRWMLSCMAHLLGWTYRLEGRFLQVDFHL